MTLQNGRQILHFAWICARAVQEGSACAIDGARVFAVQGQDVMLPAGRVIQIDVRQSFPASANADYFTSDFRAAIDHRFDYRVQSGDIAASSEYAYALL
jgi:hypothetical protein